MWRGADVARGYPVGILAYPLSVLALVLLFRDRLWMAAAGWGILAVGDGMASLVGQAAGGPRLPWNPRKGWAGFAAFVRLRHARPPPSSRPGRRACPLDPSARALAAHARRRLRPRPRLRPRRVAPHDPRRQRDRAARGGPRPAPVRRRGAWRSSSATRSSPRRALVGLAVNAAIAVPALLARSIDLSGAVSAVVIGTAITAGLGLPGLALMVAFFVLGTRGHEGRLPRRRPRAGSPRRRAGPAAGGTPGRTAASPRSWPSSPAWPPPGSRDLLALAYAAAVATAAADTCSSEVGKAYGRRTFLITSLRPVPPGTEGAISLEGTLGGFLGAARRGRDRRRDRPLRLAGRPWSWRWRASSAAWPRACSARVAERARLDGQRPPQRRQHRDRRPRSRP